MPPNYYHSIHNLKVMYAVLLLCNLQGRRSWGVGGPDPLEYVEGSEYVLTPYNVTYFRSKLLLDNSACFTS